VKEAGVHIAERIVDTMRRRERLKVRVRCEPNGAYWASARALPETVGFMVFPETGLRMLVAIGVDFSMLAEMVVRLGRGSEKESGPGAIHLPP
jgi:hypothetical protein